jgi:hypothetical protein
MEADFKSFIKQVEEISSKSEMSSCDMPLFRGHSNGGWNLKPTLYRDEFLIKKDIFGVEAPFFHDFIGLSGNSLITKDSWEILFCMRHYGVPTRLLDWTENLFVALYFALHPIENEKIENPCIWILNPYSLNKKTEFIGEYIINPEYELPPYFEMFCRDNYSKLKEEIKSKIPEYPITLYPFRKNDRIVAQSGLFTMHGTKQEGLDDEYYKDCLFKLEIPEEIIEEIRSVLKIAGFNKFSLYKDLDSLAKHLIESTK